MKQSILQLNDLYEPCKSKSKLEDNLLEVSTDPILGYCTVSSLFKLKKAEECVCVCVCVCLCIYVYLKLQGQIAKKAK